MKDVSGEILFNGQTYKIIFNLNVMEEIQEKYGSVAKWGELTDGSKGEVNAKAIIFGYTAMLNEAIDIENEEKGTNKKHFTLKQVGRLITNMGLGQMTEELNNTVVKSTKSNEKNGSSTKMKTQ